MPLQKNHQYKILKKLGKGSYGEIFLCQDQNGSQFALKAIKINFLKEDSELYFKTEVHALESLQTNLKPHNSHIIKYYSSIKNFSFEY